MTLQLAALALLDSLNVLTLTVAVYLLGTPRPVPRTLAYVAGTSVGYFSAGAILLYGWRIFLERLLPLMAATPMAAIQIIIGAVLAMAGVHAVRRPARDVVFRRPPVAINPAATFVLGAVIGFLYAPTDPRHNTAIGLIVARTEGYTAQLGWLAWYNMFYILPLLAMVVLRVLWPERSHIIFGWLTDTISNFFYRTLPYLVIGAGILLVIDGLRRSFA